MDWLTRPYVINVNTLGNFQSVVVAVLVSLMILVFMWYFHRSKLALYSAAIELTIALYILFFVLIVNAKTSEGVFWLSRGMYTVFVVLSLLAIYTTSYASNRKMPILKGCGIIVSAATVFLIYANDQWFITRDYVVSTYYMSGKGPMILLFFIYLFFIGLAFLYQMFVLFKTDRDKFNLTWSLYVGMAFVAIYGNIRGIIVLRDPSVKPGLYLNILVFSLCLVIFLFKVLKKTIDDRERMMEAFLYDDLTGVHTRAYIMEEIKAMAFRRYGDRGCVAMIDLDGFKAINDAFGHMTGDRILKEFGRLLRLVGKGFWIAGRTGGDEFMVFAVNKDPEEMEERLQELMDRYTVITDKLTGSQRPSDLGMSIGLTSIWPGEEIDSLYFRADELLYQAKKDGKNSIRHDFQPDAVKKRA